MPRVRSLRAAVEPLDGVRRGSEFPPLEQRMTVLYEPQLVDLEHVLKAVATTGLQGEVVGGRHSAAAPSRMIRLTAEWRVRAVLTAASGGFLLAAFLAQASQTGIAQAFARRRRGATGCRRALPRQLFWGRGSCCLAPGRHCATFGPTLGLLVTIAIAGAVCDRPIFEGATVAFLFAVSRSRAWALAARRTVCIPPGLHRRGRVIGREGSEGPGRCFDSAAELSILGQARRDSPGRADHPAEVRPSTSRQLPGINSPIDRRPGTAVCAGPSTRMAHSKIETTKPATDDGAQIARLVGEAQGRQAAAERWVEGFARHYTPAVWPSRSSSPAWCRCWFGAWGGWFYKGIGSSRHRMPMRPCDFDTR